MNNNKLLFLKLNFTIALFLSITLSSCGEHHKEVIAPPPLKAGEHLDPNSDFAKNWTGVPEWVTLNEQVTLKIPPEFSHFWSEKNYPNLKFTHAIHRPKEIRKIDFISFSMFMPDLSGYTPTNYLKQFNEDEVQVLYIEPAPMSYAKPDAPGLFPPNVFNRLGDRFDLAHPEEKYGLRCYEPLHPISTHRQTCYGMRDAKTQEYILLDISPPPYEGWQKFPIIQACYFTPQYGGLEILWRTHFKNFSRWQEIDHQIWQNVHDWNKAAQESK